jgi:serine-threonine kinase receptor-associated protein
MLVNRLHYPKLFIGGGDSLSRKIPLICSGHSRPVPDLSFSAIRPEGFFLISACLDGKPMLRNGETGDWIGTFMGHKGAVWSANLNSNATKAATGSADYTVKVWDAITGEELQNFNHGRIVKSVNFAKDDQRILTGGQDKILRIFDLNKPETEPLKMEGHNQSIKSALWCKDNSTIISVASESGIKVWDTRTLTCVKTQPTKAAVSGLEISLDGKHLTATAGKEVLFFNAETFEPVKQFALSVEANSAALAYDNSTFVVGGTDFWVHVYDFNTGKELEVHKGHHGPVHCVRFSPDGAMFASGSEDGTVRLWQSGELRSYGLWQEGNQENKST